jgi:hypothetical protein
LPGRAQRPARHLDLPACANHLDQELRGQCPGTAAVSWLELLALDDAGGDLGEVPKLGV